MGFFDKNSITGRSGASLPVLLQGNQLYPSRHQVWLFTPDYLRFRAHHLPDMAVKVLKVSPSKIPKIPFDTCQKI
jgi:hypothetical protein